MNPIRSHRTSQRRKADLRAVAYLRAKADAQPAGAPSSDIRRRVLNQAANELERGARRG